MERTRRPGRLGTVALVATLGLLAACGGDGDSGAAEVASLGTDAPDDGADTVDGSAGGTTDPQEAMLEYAQCMRDHGIDVPDPRPTGDGDSVVVIGGDLADGEGGVDLRADDFQAAQQACGPIMDDAIGSVEIDPEQEAEMRERMLAFAECMREQGLDFPDPTFDGTGRVQIGIGGEDGAPDPERFQAASEACNEEAGGDAPMFQFEG